jgi:hypothetical protein
MKTKIQPNTRFGKLTIVKLIPGNCNTRWECLCDCGNITNVYQPNLRSGRVVSCGCHRAQLAKSRRKEKTIVNGYVFIKMPEHPRAHPTSGRVREHIVVMEKMLGRSLLPGEEVHHKNGIRADNHPRNLELWLRSQPAGARVKDLVKWAKQILKQYQDTTL